VTSWRIRCQKSRHGRVNCGRSRLRPAAGISTTMLPGRLSASAPMTNEDLRADTAATTRGNCIPHLFRGDSIGLICDLKVWPAPLVDFCWSELHALAACESVLTKCFDADPGW